MTMTISHLPTDLVKEIVSRVPLTDMRAVRFSSKNWDTLSKSLSFMKMHIGKEEEASEGDSRLIVLINYEIHLMSIVFNENPSRKPIGKLTFLEESEKVKIAQMFHCDGLLLCILKDTLKLVVWNPYLGKTRWIEPRYSYRSFDKTDRYRYALGYSENNKSHKILRFIDNKFPSPINLVLWYEIYNFESDLWMTLEVNPHWSITFFNLGVSFKGNTYWCSTKRDSPQWMVDHIICFDFTRERFGPLLPLPFRGRDSCMNISCVREEKLAALFCHDFGGMDIWITTKIEPKDISWSKFLTVNDEIPFPLEEGSFFIDELKKVAMLFNQSLNRNTITIIGEGGGYVKQLDLGKCADEDCLPHVCSYIPTLVQIKQLERGKRKNQSSLEKCRFDQHMSRLKASEEPVSKRRKD